MGHKEIHAPQSMHLSSSTNTRPFLLTITLFFFKASVMFSTLSIGISKRRFTPLDPVENFNMLNVISYFKISLIIFE